MTILHDFHGNNAVVECTECHKVFGVSAYIDKAGRLCPRCGKTRAYANPKDKSVAMHKVPKGEVD